VRPSIAPTCHRSTRLGAALIASGGLALFTLNCCVTLPRRPVATSPVASPNAASPPTRKPVCRECVKWRIPRVDPSQLPAYKYAFNDGTLVYVDRHGVRRDAATFEASPTMLGGRAEAAMDVGEGRVAWLHEGGDVTWTTSPMGPVVSLHAAPSLPVGETVARVFQTRNAFFVVGSRTSVWRSMNGGGSWQPLNLGLSAFVKFRDVSITNERTILLRYFPLHVVQSNDDGLTWKRVAAPQEDLEPYHGWPKPWESDPAGFIADDEPLAGERFHIAGDQLVRLQVNEVKEVRIASGDIAAVRNETRIQLPPGETIWDTFISGDGLRQALAVVIKRDEQFQIVPYRRERPDTDFERLPPLAFPGLPPLGPFVSHETYVLLDRNLPAPHALVQWANSRSPRSIQLFDDGAWPEFAFNSPHFMIWGFDNDGHVSLQRVTSETLELRMHPVAAFLPRILNARRSAAVSAVEFSGVTFDADGTLRCIVSLFGCPGLYLLRVRSNGSVLPIHQLPFELPQYEGRTVSSHGDRFDGAVSLTHDRGYSALGWETADGGEHWTRVDAYVDARSTVCISSGCLVDQARRVGWALPAGFTGGMASTELETLSIPDANARELRSDIQ